MNEMAPVTAKELKEHIAGVLSRVQYGGERVFVTRHGKEVAAVVSIEDARLLDELEDVLDAHDALEALDEAERDGTISLTEFRKRLGR
jgi:prevent-host-death family protein